MQIFASSAAIQNFVDNAMELLVLQTLRFVDTPVSLEKLLGLRLIQVKSKIDDHTLLANEKQEIVSYSFIINRIIWNNFRTWLIIAIG